MCFLTDAHRLFDNALGLYDLELTLMVAQQAQRVSNIIPPNMKMQRDSHRNRTQESTFHSSRNSGVCPICAVSMRSTTTLVVSERRSRAYTLFSSTTI